MSRMKRLAVQQLDVSKDYLVIGLDLAKTDTAVIAITTDGELYACLLYTSPSPRDTR